MSEPWRIIEAELVHWFKEHGVSVSTSFGVPSIRIANGVWQSHGYTDISLMDLAKRLEDELREV